MDTALAAIAVALGVMLAVGAVRAGAAPLTEFKLPAGTSVTSLIDGGHRTMWFGEMTGAGNAEIGRITTAGKITQITSGFLPGALIHDLAIGATARSGSPTTAPRRLSGGSRRPAR